jgi:hypothetical protein
LKRLSITTLYCLALLARPALAADTDSLQVEGPDLLPPVASTVIGINSRSTFLRINAEITAKDAKAIDLAKLGLKTGDWLRLEVLGEFSYSDGEMPEDVKVMNGVFSSTARLLPADQLNRVVGAVDVGPEIATPPTMYGDYATDVAQDFPIASTRIQIPAGARFLFVAPPDIFYSDNVDTDGNFALRITVL